MIDTPYVYKRGSSSLSSSRARYVYVCVRVIRMCVYIYMCAERERSSFFDERIELNSHENSSPVRGARIFARAPRGVYALPHLKRVLLLLRED